jgi:hypothetical protein
MLVITFDEPQVRKYSVYTIRLDGVVVANIYGSMAAIASEAVCRYLESQKGDINVSDFRKRVQDEEDRDDESENSNL